MVAAPTDDRAASMSGPARVGYPRRRCAGKSGRQSYWRLRRERLLTGTSNGTVSALIARFALRRRANTSAFNQGVRLARIGAVTLDQISPGEIRAHVQDGDDLAVRVFAVDDQLLGECPCAFGEPVPCRHQVAVAHVVWVRDRRGIE
jgi:uncharacterized Zn finger protein